MILVVDSKDIFDDKKEENYIEGLFLVEMKNFYCFFFSDTFLLSLCIKSDFFFCVSIMTRINYEN